MPDKTIVIWGAGRIGRGFAADLFSDAGYRPILVEQAQPLVDSLRERGHYTVVWTTGVKRQDRVIADLEVLSTSQTDAVADALAAADLVAVAVFPRDFPSVARQMVPGLLRRRAEQADSPIDIILCTNLAHAGPAFQEPLLAALPPEARLWAREHVGIVESLVIRMVADPPEKERVRDPLLVWTNGYAEFPVDRLAFKGEIPPVAALRLVGDMRAEETRKLYTYNAFHGALAYLGALHGHTLVVDSLGDAWVREQAQGVLREASAALQAEHGFAADEMARWIEGVVAQTDNPALGDTVARFGADPYRKLGRADRLIGPLLLARKHRIETPHLIRAIAAALLYRPASDEGAARVQRLVQTLGTGEALRTIAGLEKGEEDLEEAVAAAYTDLEAEVYWADLACRAGALAFEYEQTFHGCGQCSLAAIMETLSQVDEARYQAAFDAATAFAGGLGLAGDATCGALVGSTLAFGLLYPRRRAHFGGDRDNKYRAYEMAQRLRQRYLDAYGGVRCHEVHRAVFGRAYDLRDAEERVAFEAAGAHDDKCTGVVARAVQWAMEIIGEEQRKSAQG
jgi:mannitol-1-phosphate 5-dehydrogenase